MFFLCFSPSSTQCCRTVGSAVIQWTTTSTWPTGAASRAASVNTSTSSTGAAAHPMTSRSAIWKDSWCVSFLSHDFFFFFERNRCLIQELCCWGWHTKLSMRVFQYCWCAVMHAAIAQMSWYFLLLLKKQKTKAVKLGKFKSTGNFSGKCFDCTALIKARGTSWEDKTSTCSAYWYTYHNFSSCCHWLIFSAWLVSSSVVLQTETFLHSN